MTTTILWLIVGALAVCVIVLAVAYVTLTLQIVDNNKKLNDLSRAVNKNEVRGMRY